MTHLPGRALDQGPERKVPRRTGRSGPSPPSCKVILVVLSTSVRNDQNLPLFDRCRSWKSQSHSLSVRRGNSTSNSTWRDSRRGDASGGRKGHFGSRTRDRRVIPRSRRWPRHTDSPPRRPGRRGDQEHAHPRGPPRRGDPARRRAARPGHRPRLQRRLFTGSRGGLITAAGAVLTPHPGGPRAPRSPSPSRAGPVSELVPRRP